MTIVSTGVPIAHFEALQFAALVALVAGFATDEHRARFLTRIAEMHGAEARKRLRAAVWEHMQKQERLFA